MGYSGQGKTPLQKNPWPTKVGLSPHLIECMIRETGGYERPRGTF